MEMFGEIGIIGNGTAVVSMKANNSANEKAATKVQVYTEDKVNTTIAAWGANNNLPQLILESVRKNGAATSGLSVVKDAHYGKGFILMKESFTDPDEKGIRKRTITPVSLLEYPEIKEFFRVSQMNRFFKETIADEEYFAIAFPEYILSNDYNKISKVRRKQAAQMRFELMNDDANIENVWLSTKWKEGVSLDSKFAAKIPHIDSYLTAEEVKEHCKKYKIQNFVRPIFYTMMNESYYPIASWHSAYYSKWIEISNSIPEFKKALFENQSSIKYHIEVENQYFANKYKDKWEEFTVKEQDDIRSAFITFLDTNLRGVQNAGTSIWSMMYERDGQLVSGVRITAIDDKLKDGAFLPDGLAANEEIYSAISVDSTLTGAGTPGGLGAGSGSDKREAWLILSARQKPKRETTLETFEFIQQYNGWPSDLIGVFEDTQLTTLDKNPTGTKNAVNI